MTKWQPKLLSGADAGPATFPSTNNRETEELSARPGKLRGSYSAQRMVMGGYHRSRIYARGDYVGQIQAEAKIFISGEYLSRPW